MSFCKSLKTPSCILFGKCNDFTHIFFIYFCRNFCSIFAYDGMHAMFLFYIIFLNVFSLFPIIVFFKSAKTYTKCEPPEDVSIFAEDFVNEALLVGFHEKNIEVSLLDALPR